MSQTTTTIGRLQLADPDLDYDTLDGGTNLHNQLRTNWTAVADHLTTRYSGSITLANTASVTLTHNFNLALAKLRVFIFISGAQLTRAQVTAQFSITSAGANTIAVQNISGSSKTFQVVIIAYQSPLESIDGVDIISTPPSVGQALVWDGTKFIPGSVGGGGSTVYRSGALTLGTIGSAGQKRAGHVYSSGSFPTAITSSKISWWNLASTADNSANGRTLTNGGGVTFGAADPFGGTGAAQFATNDSTAKLSLTDSYLDPATGKDYEFGFWIKLNQIVTNGSLVNIAFTGGSIDLIFESVPDAPASLHLYVQEAATTILTAELDSEDQSRWIRIDCVISPNRLSLAGEQGISEIYIDGKLISQGSLSTSLGSAWSGSASLNVGYTAFEGVFTNGAAPLMYGLYAVAGAPLYRSDVRKLFGYKHNHAAALSGVNQDWNADFRSSVTSLLRQDAQSWLLDKSDSNNVYCDFTELDEEFDTVEIVLNSR